MAIPAISIYKMPTESDLPMNKVTWKLDPKRATTSYSRHARIFS